MAVNSFLQKANLFSYSGTNCVRNDYYHHDCHICVDICPENAFHIIRNKLTLFENECTGCSACIGSCPTEALTIESFDPNAFSVVFHKEEKPELSCKKNTPCLGVFDAHHLITMALDGTNAPVCDMRHCEGCPINAENKLERSIREKIAVANTFLENVGLEKRITTIDEKEEEEVNPKRMLFRKAVDKAKVAIEAQQLELGMTLAHQKSNEHTGLPLKNIILKEAIRKNSSKFEKTAFKEQNPLFFNKKIIFEKCTNCGDCAQFCPTEALTLTADKQGINFVSGNCIGCGICDDICKTDAIYTDDSFDLISIAYDRMETLVHYEMVMCHECRCPYPYRGGDPICDRCVDFKKDFSGMFTLAKDQ
ncbi:4Fe-4S binding protein [Sulfurimonas sp. HSL3-7]|uniref:4Fe-4S binding protein n=1 Tax=Sulfonitrofixus jiaomeiensis TaxID=3131938 RepID=UPI0031F9D9F4